MSSFLDMISAFIAMLISAALLHFGAASESHPATPVASAASHSLASPASTNPLADPVTDDDDHGGDIPATPAADHRGHAHRLSAHQCPRSHAAPPVVETVRAPSPLRHG